MTTDLPPEEREAIKAAKLADWELDYFRTKGEIIAYNQAVERGWRRARKYSKQREEKLRDLLARAVDFESFAPGHTQWLREIGIALAENGDTDAG